MEFHEYSFVPVFSGVCRRAARTALCALTLSLCFLVSADTPAQPQEAQTVPSTREFPFVNGSLMVPAVPGMNNSGVLTDQTVPGQTHIEAYLFWRELEPEQGKWDFSEFDKMLALSTRYDQKMLAFPWVNYAPEWFLRTNDYVRIVDMETGHSPDILSPWAPGTLQASDYFYRELAQRYRDDIDIILIGYPSSDYGEVGMPMGAPGFVDGKGVGTFFPQNADFWHMGYWCGDRYARADFRERMLKKHGSVAAVNRAWGTRFVDADAIVLPDPKLRQTQRRYWIDFTAWYQETQTRVTRDLLAIIRKHFPSTLLEVPLGYGSEHIMYGMDRSAICKMAAEFPPINVRSTQGSFNRDIPPRAYWFYKRTVPTCHEYGVGFGTEPPGGDLTYDELRRQYFEDASAGISLFYTYFQNYHLRPDVVDELKAILRPGEKTLVDIGILYPSTQMRLDANHFPEGQLAFCNAAREFFDYDVVDENMIAWGLLKNYRVLVATSGRVFEAETFEAIGRWIESGGVLITDSRLLWETVEGETAFTSTQVVSAQMKRIGLGRWFNVDIPSTGKYVSEVLGILKKIDGQGRSGLHGFDGEDDGKWTTEFPGGNLIFNTETLDTEFVAHEAGKR